jgi:hypothetical protein
VYRFWITVLACAAVSMPALAQTSMSSMSTAKPKCATGDALVWADGSAKTYYLQGSLSYGKTAHGHYACASTAKSMGLHADAVAPGGMMPSAAPPTHGPNPPQPKFSGTTSPEP